MLKCISTALLLACSGVVSAQQVSTTEAWISKSSFDGDTFKYQYTAYDAKTAVKEDIKVNCIYTKHQDGIILKSVEIKILLTANFSEMGTAVISEGELSVQSEINKCIHSVVGIKKDIIVPVSVILPQISVPIKQ